MTLLDRLVRFILTLPPPARPVRSLDQPTERNRRRMARRARR